MMLRIHSAAKIAFKGSSSVPYSPKYRIQLQYGATYWRGTERWTWLNVSTSSDKLWNKSEMWCWSVIPNCQMFSDRFSSTGLEQKVHLFRVLYLITLTGVGEACCPPRPEALTPMLIYVTSDCTVKLVEVCFQPANNARVDLELSHSSEHLNLAKSKVSWDLTAYSWFLSFAKDHSAVQNVRQPSQTHQRGSGRFALLQIDVEKHFVEEHSASEGASGSMGGCAQHSDGSSEWSQEVEA